MIIDIHTHLGDILHPGGGALIDKTGVRKKILFDITGSSERFLHSAMPGPVERWVYRTFDVLVTKSSRARNATATLENMRNAMMESGVTSAACMPIPPYVTFADLKKANDNDHRVIPFTGVDYASGNGFEAALAEDVRQGARGMKLHPIIQREPLNGQRTFDAVEAFAVHGLPVLFHCGVSSYYLKPDRDVLEDPSLGWISDAKELVAAFPNVTFIAGHAGLMEYREVISLLSGHKNVRVDTSFHSPARVRKLIDAFGPERVMYASDWPYGNMMPAVRIIEKACRGDRGLERRVFYENAAEVLGVG